MGVDCMYKCTNEESLKGGGGGGGGARKIAI